MRAVLRIFYMIMLPLLMLLYPILRVIRWVYDLLRDYWWDKATEMADDTIAQIREKK